MGSIGYRIRCAREAIGVTQGQLGKLCGTTKQTIFKYENGIITNIPMDRIQLIAQHLSVTPAYLLGWSSDPLAGADGKKTFIQTSSKDGLSTEEQELIQKFRRLDARGRSAVMNVLNYEYTSLAGDEGNPLPKQA